jgi:hypothetical protein
VLLALGETVMLVFPVLLELEELGETVIVLPLTSPLPLADGLLVTDELPPYVVLDVDDDPLEVAVPLPPEPLVAVDVAGAPAVVAPVVVAAVAPSANAGAATRMTNNAAAATPVIADARDACKRCLNVDVSSELITDPPSLEALYSIAKTDAHGGAWIPRQTASTSLFQSPLDASLPPQENDAESILISAIPGKYKCLVKLVLIVLLQQKHTKQ